jgi:hypothetical protein
VARKVLLSVKLRRAFGVTDPFYQRAYVWAKEEQWEPLWNDVVGLDSLETATRLRLKNKLKSIT